MIKILVLGASKHNIGEMIARQNQNPELDITLYSRRPLSVPQTKFILGDGLDLPVLTAAMKNMDIVWSNLGTSNMENFAKTVVQAMKNADVKRLYWTTTVGLYHEMPKLDALKWYSLFGRPETEGSFYNDQLKSAQLIHDSGLDETVLRLGYLTNQSASGKYVLTNDKTYGNAHSISRSDVALAGLEMMSSPEKYLHGDVAITSK